MNVDRAGPVDPVAARERADAARSVLVRALVGDRLGLVLFLGTLAVTGVFWRLGVFITDNYTLANALVALADGTLVVDEAVYGSLEAPGMQVHDDRLYGRNYGQVAFAIPFLWALRGLAAVADPGLVFASLWSLLVLALAVQAGRLFGRRSLCAGVGAVVALSAFGVNAVLAEPIPASLLPLAALQLSAMVATALVAATTYRLVARIHDRRVGAVAGALSVLATPVGFWASMPKRHAYVLALVLGVAYAVYRSRDEPAADSLLSPTGFRALAYALVGLLTWIHAGEGFVVFLALVAVDVPTARSNDARTLAVVGAAFAASLLPFFATNALISGDPLRPPRMLAEFGTLSGDAAFGAGSGPGAGGGSGSGGAVLPPAVRAPLSEAMGRAGLLFGPFVAGARAVVDEPEAMYQTFVRSGFIEGVSSKDHDQAINLTVLEAAPLTAGAVAILATAAARVGVPTAFAGDRSLRQRLSGPIRGMRRSPALATDAFVGLTAVLFFLVYIPRLPVYAQVTVRYLMPLYPFALYAMARQPSIRRALAGRGRLALWSYLGGVLVGGQLFFATVTVGSFGRGGAFQLHAVVGLAAAAVVGLLAIASVADDRADGPLAVAGGLAAALGTNLVVLSGLVYFQYGPYALPVVDWLADLLAAA